MTTMDNDHEILSSLNINNILYNYYNFKGCYPADNIPIIKLAENEINDSWLGFGGVHKCSSNFTPLSAGFDEFQARIRSNWHEM